MWEICRESECIGCGVCKQICSAKCIEIKEDEEGFLKPAIDNEKCIKCGACRNKCPILNYKQQQDNTFENAYACANKNEKVLKKSSSGGVFYELAKYFINRNGIVFGASLDENCEVKHIYVDNLKEIDKLLGSKYVQSEIGVTFLQTQNFLEKGKKVLFTGTPCQIYALKKYLRKDYDNLYTLDFICTGVPSRKIYRDYINSKKETPLKVFFRDKRNGWKHFGINIKYSSNEKYTLRYLDNYIQAMYRHISLMKSCYKCMFKELNSQSDIKLGDFWGIETINDQLPIRDGVSLVIINSKKMKEVFDIIKENLFFTEVSLQTIKEKNISFIKSAKNALRDDFFCEYIRAEKKDKQIRVLKKYTKNGILNTIKIKIIVKWENLKYKILNVK